MLDSSKVFGESRDPESGFRMTTIFCVIPPKAFGKPGSLLSFPRTLSGESRDPESGFRMTGKSRDQDDKII